MTVPKSQTTRGRFHGVLQILDYNRGFYANTFAAIVALFFSLRWLPKTLALATAAGCLVTAAWIIASLLVSHFIYDRSSLYELAWIRQRLPQAHINWINIHAGLDETTELLRPLFSDGTGHVFDIYDPKEMTEPSIARARRPAAECAATLADFRALPLPDEYADAVFLIFSVHEIRNDTSRTKLFTEIARSLKPNGTVIVIEHLRDIQNFLAFGPGFLHFHSRRKWLYAFGAAGLQVKEEFSITAFVHVFVLNLR
ncbi:MAG: Methyltransferase type 11 [Candidatus Angelobacter sp.]|jgi:SAM-dependent methyltransferase|nr:Methyltransferase type 11 [Candidatus Angelobacter sp.]